jgi:hypothetical protein
MKKKVIKISAVILVLLLIAGCITGFVITKKEMDKNFGRGDYPDRRFTAAWFYDHYEPEYPPSGGQLQVQREYPQGLYLRRRK